MKEGISKWEISNDSYIKFNKLESKKNKAGYMGMARIEPFSSTLYKLRITIKYIFEFKDTTIELECVSFVTVTTDIPTTLFVKGNDSSSLKILTDIIQRIEEGIMDTVSKDGKLKKIHKTKSLEEIKKDVDSLLLSYLNSNN